MVKIHHLNPKSKCIICKSNNRNAQCNPGHQYPQTSNAPRNQALALKHQIVNLLHFQRRQLVMSASHRLLASVAPSCICVACGCYRYTNYVHTFDVFHFSHTELQQPTKMKKIHVTHLSRSHSFCSFLADHLPTLLCRQMHFDFGTSRLPPLPLPVLFFSKSSFALAKGPFNYHNI